MPDDTRIDRWLCAVRLVKTRPMATQLCEGGHARVNGNPATPSTKVRAGDVVQALIGERERVVEVVRPIETRVGAPAAATCYIDNSPPPVIREIAPGIKAVRGEGRPSKRLRPSSNGCGGPNRADLGDSSRPPREPRAGGSRRPCVHGPA
jgi:ribosome-associated heat shock protein Hsp15